MPILESRIDTLGSEFKDNAAHMLAHIAQLRSIEARTRQTSEKSAPLFAKRGQLLPRERLNLLLDAGAPFLELSTLAGYLQDSSNPDISIAGGGGIAGIGYVSGVRCMVNLSDSGIEAGALQEKGIEKFQRMQHIALENALPFVNLVESAGANLLKYKVEHFIHGGSNFYNLARLSAAGIPVLTIVHGSSTAGGAYLPGLSDYVIMVKGKARAFLAGPPLLKAATGEIAHDEELGGAEMHSFTSGLSEYLAQDDADGIRIARELIGKLGWKNNSQLKPVANGPRYSAEDLLGIMPAAQKKPVDMREIIARIVDESDFLEFKANYGAATLCGHARIMGQAVGLISNLGPIDTAGANKVTHFIQSCCQTGTPLVYLQNTTGYLVGKDAEQGGIIKHGSKMIQAVSNATVPQITLLCGASFGAGNYGMCGRGFGPRFVFSWPTAKTAVMGAEQAANTMAEVMMASARRKGLPTEGPFIDGMRAEIIKTFERQTSAFYTSGLLLDDGVIDPRHTRAVLGLVLDVCMSARHTQLNPLQFAVARP
jgi:geranyl-CoA carboxylase beta subunit